MDFRALGKVLAPPAVPASLSGTYHSDHFGDFHLQQAGAGLSGCYEHSGGTFTGGAESVFMRLTWHETPDRSGPAILVMTRDG